MNELATLSPAGSVDDYAAFLQEKATVAPLGGIEIDADQVADELADIAISALVAMGRFSVDPIQRLTNRAAFVVARIKVVS